MDPVEGFKTNLSDPQTPSVRPSSLDLNSTEAIKAQELQLILDQLKKSPSFHNSILNFNKNSPAPMANLNSQQFISFSPHNAPATRLATSTASPGASLIFLANSQSTNHNSGHILLDNTNASALQQIPMNVNLCSPVTLTSSAQQHSTLTNLNASGSQPELLQPVVLQSSAAISLNKNNEALYTAAAGSRNRSGDTVDNNHVQRIERKRARNRDAAKKCRERKLSLINSLQCYVHKLNEDNKALKLAIAQEKDEVKRLKSFVVDHMEKECEFINKCEISSNAESTHGKTLPTKKRKYNE